MKTRLSTAVLVAFLVAGCAMPSVTGTTPGATVGANGTVKPGDKTPIVDPKTGKPLPNQPVEPLNGIEFKPLTQGSAQYLSNNGGGGVTATAGASAPMAAPAATSIAKGGAMMDSSTESRSSGGTGSTPQVGGAFSGNVWSAYQFGYYFGYGGGGMDQMALVSVQEAETKGSSGSFASVVGDIVGPIVKVWAADGRLTQSGAVLTNDGKIYVEPRSEENADMMIARPGYGGPFGNGNGWRMVYTSTDRKEILSFTVTAEKTTIIRMRWAPLDLAPERVLVDSSAAVKKLIDAITDKTYQGEEEKTMKDYFMGYPFEQPKTGQWDGEDNKTEVLYTVPANARWNVNLQNVMGKVVWELNWWAEEQQTNGGPSIIGKAMPVPTSAVMEDGAVEGDDNGGSEEIRECGDSEKISNSYTNWNGQGMIDAETGAVIRFTRPTKNTYTYYNGPDYPCPKPTARPIPVGTSEPIPTPTSTPNTEVTPSPVASDPADPNQ